METQETRTEKTNGKSADPAVPKPSPRKRKARRAYFVLFALAAGGLGVYFIHGYLTRDKIDTDNAQVEADVVPLAARVAGVIQHMRVTDYTKVEAGAVLAEIDPADFVQKRNAAQAELAAAVAQADAADAQVEIVRSTMAGGLSSAEAQVRGSTASVRSAAAQIDAAAAALSRAKAERTRAVSEYERTKKLYDTGATTGQALEVATTARDSAQAAVDAAEANLAAARSQQTLSESRVAEARGRLQQSAPVDRQIAAAMAAARLAHARVDAAKAALELATLQLSYTKITAPIGGYVSRLAAHDGQTVQAGTTLLYIVPAETYVVANFKETQLERIRPGDPADVSIDALGGRTLHGKVAEIAPATGARFALIPPDNATGNFVKVVQRVPVKIVWKPGESPAGLRAGLSAEVVVHLTK